MFLKASAMESVNSFLNEGGVQLVEWSVVAQKGANILIFHVFEYGAEYGAECSSKPGTK